MNNKILVMYSGGLDSVYMLHVLLTDAQYSEYDIHVHHINIHNYERRTTAESIAVESSLKWFRDNGYRLFTDSSSDYGLKSENRIMDVELAINTASIIARRDFQIVKIALGATADDFTLFNSPSHRREGILSAAERLKMMTNIDRIHPLKEITKADAYEALPEGLKDKFWSCRTPKYVNDRPQPCGRCMTCSHFNSFGVKLAGI